MDYPILQMESGGGNDHPSRHERALWRAVITQALMDASNQSSKMEAKYEKRQATCWLTGYSEDFKTVCDYAGLAPAYVRQQALDALGRGCKWRAESPQRKPKAVLEIC